MEYRHPGIRVWIANVWERELHAPKEVMSAVLLVTATGSVSSSL